MGEKKPEGAQISEKLIDAIARALPAAGDSAYKFVLIFVVLIVLALTMLGARVGGPWLAVSLIGVIAAGGLLAGFTIAVVERNKSLATQTRQATAFAEEQAEKAATFQADYDAARKVLGGLLDNSTDTYVVYSSHKVSREALRDHEDHEINHPATEQELNVSTFMDVRGIAQISSLLHAGGKEKNLRVVTAFDWEDDMWEANLVLIGSRLANPITEKALERYKCPFRFSWDVTTLTDRENEVTWPAQGEDLSSVDYGLLAKMLVQSPKGKEHDRIWLVAAGLGASGTRAACKYLHDSLGELARDMTSEPFAGVVRVDKNNPSFVDVVSSRKIAPRPAMAHA